jgi:periplasmic nitrate reductase NapD
LRTILDTPNPDGGYEIASVIVHVRPEHIDDVAETIAAMPGHSLAARDARGKLVVVLESGPGDRLGDSLTTLSTLAKVISATLVYQAVEASPESALSESA